MWKESVIIDTIYDFDYELRRLAMDPLNKVDIEKRTVSVPVEIGKNKHLVQVTASGTTNKPAFEISNNSIEDKQQLIETIFQLFQWDINLQKIGDHFIGTNLEKLFHTYPGTPVVKDFHPYSSLMKTIIHQQLNMKFAHTLTNRFVEKYGENIQGVWFYPKPETVAAIPYQELRELQFSQRKAEYVIDTSRKIANKELDLDLLTNKSDDEIIQQLVKIRGIGNWTAENWLLFGLGRKNHLPMADIGVQNAIISYFGKEKKPTIPEIDQLSTEWAPFRSYATLTLWRSIEELNSSI